MTWHVLDLFAGLGGFSQAFAESEEWAVTTVEIEERFDPDIQADVFDLRPSDFEQDFDVILASPPCTDFSMAASRYGKIVDGEPQTESARESVTLVYHTIGLIKALAPAYWVLENPKGYLHQFLGHGETWVTWCQYGEEYMKPTELWGNLPPTDYRRCKTGDSCHVTNRDGEHGGRGNCDVIGSDAAERAKVPSDFSKAIRDACEAGLLGEVPEQVSLEEVA